jgi:putative tryptophan/tyrosine transport system substrate-binding protein
VTLNRRHFLALSGAGLALTPLSAISQPATRLFRVAHLSGSGAAASKPFLAAFREGMRSLGYIENQHWTLQARFAEGKVERLASLARECLDGHPDVLLTATTPGVLAAKAAGSKIPIVFVLVADPIGAGVVSSLARPGGNITGITNIVAELAGKRLELLKEIVPSAKRIAVLLNPNSQNAPLQMQHAEAGARQLGVELSPVVEIRSAGELDHAFETIAQAHAHAVLRMIDPLLFILRKETAALAAKYRLPVIYPTREDAEAGGLAAYGADIPGQYRQAAAFVDKILRGAQPAALPVEQPIKFEFVINLKAAKALNLRIPQSILVRADEVIE